MNLSNNILIQFENITQYKLSDYLDKTSIFFSRDYPVILDFFSGRTSVITPNTLQTLISIDTESKTIKSLIKLNRDKFENSQYWDLIIGLDDISTKIQTVKKISKYLRSTITSYNYSQTVSFNKTLNYNQNIEDLVRSEFDKNSEGLAHKIALQNDLLEGDWNIDGGQNITLTKENQNALSQVTSMVDNPTNESILGKDIPTVFEFTGDDIKVLSYQETLNQTILILSQLRKGDLPLDIEKGMDPNIGPGNTVGILTIKAIIRQIQENFATDDLFNGVFVDEIKYIEGDLYIRYTVNVKLNTPISTDTVL